MRTKVVLHYGKGFSLTPYRQYFWGGNNREAFLFLFILTRGDELYVRQVAIENTISTNTQLEFVFSIHAAFTNNAPVTQMIPWSWHAVCNYKVMQCCVTSGMCELPKEEKWQFRYSSTTWHNLYVKEATIYRDSEVLHIYALNTSPLLHGIQLNNWFSLFV